MYAASEIEYVADSQFDFPGNDNGWRYLTLSPDNQFGDWRMHEESAQTGTPGAFLVADDVTCRIGRDFVHPGHERRACLQWNSPAAVTDLVIEGEVAQIFADAAGPVNVRVYVDDLLLHDANVTFGRHHYFTFAFKVQPQGFVRVVFARHGEIRHNDALFYVALRPPTEDERRRGRTFQAITEVDAAASLLDTAIRELVAPKAADAEVRRLERQLFGASAVQPENFCLLLERASALQFGRHNLMFRSPRMFSAGEPR